MDREIEGFKKSITEEQEKNQKLTMQLNWSEMDCTVSKKLIGQKKAQQEALQAQYSTCLRTLKETEQTLARLSKVARGQRLLFPQLHTKFIQSQHLCPLFALVTITLFISFPALF